MASTDRVVTRVRLGARPDAVWRSLVFFEDVPRGPWSIFRLVLPRPLRTEGDKGKVDSIVRCVYEHGHLIKRITAVEPGHCLRFDVVEQHLGIERVFRAHAGAYELSEVRGGTEVALTTTYRGGLWPRFFWRHVERFLGHRFHHYILLGMRETLESEPHLLVEPIGAREEGRSAAAPPR